MVGGVSNNVDSVLEESKVDLEERLSVEMTCFDVEPDLDARCDFMKEELCFTDCAFVRAGLFFGAEGGFGFALGSTQV